MRKITLSLASWVALVLPAAASANPITVQFTGTVTQVPIDDLYGDIAVGSSIEGSYMFNSTAVDLIPADPASGSYTFSGAPFEMLVSIDGHAFAASDSVNIGVFDSVVDQYTVLALGASGNLTLELLLEDDTTTAFGNDSVPLPAPLLGAFAVKDFHLQQVASGGEFQVDGQVTSLRVSPVPEPSAGLLLCVGSAVLLLLWRKRLSISTKFKEEHRMPLLQSHCLAPVLLLAGLTSNLYAVDGISLIDQNRALAGNVTPRDTPGFPVSITQPGSYKLSGNLIVPDGSMTVIEISSDFVTLDLNGFSIIGPVDCSGGFPCNGVSTGYDIGIGIKAGGLSTHHYFNLTIRNGTIHGMAGSGIYLAGDSIVVEDMHVRSNGWYGMYLSRNVIFGPGAQSCVIVRHNTVQLNGSRGIVLQAGLVVDNAVSLNGGDGIAVSLEGTVARNVSNNNGRYGLLLGSYVG